MRVSSKPANCQLGPPQPTRTVTLPYDFVTANKKTRLQRIERQPVELIGAAGEIDHPHVRRVAAERFAEFHQVVDARGVYDKATAWAEAGVGGF